MLDDVRHTVRFLLREPLLAAAVVVTLGVAMGINSAIFSVLDAVVLRPLPYPSPQQLVEVSQLDRTDGSPFVVSPANFLDWQRETRAFDSLAALQTFQDTDYSLATSPAAASVKGLRVSPDLFKVLRVSPVKGRPFAASDAEPGRDAVAIVAYDFWTAQLGSDPEPIGKVLRLNGRPLTIVGVMPRGFEVTHPLARAQIYVPLAWTAEQRKERRIANYVVLGRIKDGMSIAEATAALDPLARALEQQYPVTNKDTGILLQPLHQVVAGDVGPALVAILGAAGCVLLLACFNLANLLGTHGLKRQGELAIRAALGASRFRLMRQTVIEVLLMTTLGGVAGLVWGTWTVRFFVTLFNDTRYFSLPRRGEIGLDWRVAAFIAAMCLITAILVSAAPAARAMAGDIVAALRRPDGRREGRWRAILMTGEAATSLALVIASVLLARSYARLQAEAPGFSSTRRLTARIALPAARYESAASRAAFFEQLAVEAGTLPGVAGAAAVQLLPLNGIGALWSVTVPGHATDPANAFYHVITPRYFDVMEIPIRLGRAFTAQDTIGNRRVVILSATAAARYFPDVNPIGRIIRIEDRAHVEWEVVGVVGDVRNQRLDRAPRPQMYVPVDQSPATAMTVILRADENPLALARPLRDLVRRLDPEQAIADVKTLAQVVDDSSARWRVSTFVFLGFGASALILALLGLHSVTLYNVLQRSREMALRLALGATRAGVVRMVVRSLAGIATAGVAFGVLLGIAMGRGLSTLLYRVEPLDPAVFAGSAIVFAALMLASGAVAAFRASNVEPAAALKDQ
jgi:putative ABC transport system permease protein